MHMHRPHHNRFSTWLRLSLLLVWCWPSASLAFTFYVSPSGSAAIDCTTARTTGATNVTQRKATINQGIACMGGSGGHTVVVGNGTYDEGFGDFNGVPSGAVALPSGTSASTHTVVRAETPRGATVRLSTGAASPSWTSVVSFENGRQWVTVDGLVIDGEFTRRYGLALHNVTELLFANAHITRAEAAGIKTEFHTACVFRNLEISFTALNAGVTTCPLNTCADDTYPADTCRFDFCHAVYQGCPLCGGGTSTYDGGYYHDNDGHGLQLYGANNVVKNVTFANNTIGVGLYGGPALVYNNTFQNHEVHLAGHAPTIIGNTFHGYSVRPGAGLPRPGAPSGMDPVILALNETAASTIQNNLLLSFPSGTLIQAAPGSTLGGNVCDRSGFGCNAVIAATPSPVVNAATGDFHLPSTSLAIDRGVSLGSPYNVDKGGQSRTPPFDSGAYEASSIGAPHYLAFGQGVSDIVAGAAMSPPPTLEIRDVNHVVVPTDTRSITVSLGQNPAGGTLSGTLTRAAVAGIATFPGLTVNTVGTGYTLRGTTTGIPDPTDGSDFFAVTPAGSGPATTLAFGQQPTTAGVGAPLTPPVTVLVRDAAGLVVTTSTATITLALATNPAGGTLSCGPLTCTRAAVAGEATFDTLSLNIAGTGYSLGATAVGLTFTTSTTFAITTPPPPPTDLSISLFSTGFFAR